MYAVIQLADVDEINGRNLSKGPNVLSIKQGRSKIPTVLAMFAFVSMATLANVSWLPCTLLAPPTIQARFLQARWVHKIQFKLNFDYIY